MSKANLKKSGKYLLVYLFYFLIQIKFLNDEWFYSDEQDIMIMGKSIARGHLLYRDLCSQHMPFSYYISAFFDAIGFRTVDEQRIAFYLLIALFWTIIYFRYQDVMKSKVLFWAPLVLSSCMQTYLLGTQILSEHLAGCGAVILLLEYLRFLNTRKVPVSSCVLLSIAIVLTFGTTFISIYGVFFIALGVLIAEVKTMVREKQKFGKWFASMLKKYIPLLIIVAIPWIILFAYYLAVGTFRDFITGAYTLNRKFYSQYLEGGLGENALTPMLGPIDALVSFFVDSSNVSAWSYSTILFIFIVLGAVIYIIDKWLDGERIPAVIICLFAFSFGVRGIFSYHGTACVEVLTLLFTDVVFNKIFVSMEEFKKKSVYKRALMYVFVIFILAGYFHDISEITTIRIDDDGTWNEAEMVETLTDRDEAVWCPVLNNDILMTADRPVGFTYPSTPWTWMGYRWKFDVDKKNPARVIIYRDNHGVWDHLQADYAPELDEFVKEEYKQLSGNIWVRNDYYEEAQERVKGIE